MNKTDLTTSAVLFRLELTGGRGKRDSEAGRAIRALDQMIRNWLVQRALPYPDPGFHLLPASLREETQNYMTQKAEERLALVEKTDSPELFSMSWRYLPVSKPEGMVGMDELHDSFLDVVVQEARCQLRREFAARVSTILPPLMSAANETRRRPPMYTTRITRFRAWMDLFNHRNLSGDDELVELVEYARKSLAGFSGESIKDSDAARLHILPAFLEIQERILAMDKADFIMIAQG